MFTNTFESSSMNGFVNEIGEFLEEYDPCGIEIFEDDIGVLFTRTMTLTIPDIDGFFTMALGGLVNIQLDGDLNDTACCVIVNSVFSSEHATINTCSALNRPEIETFPSTVKLLPTLTFPL
jgi:hypothetical protein